MASGFVGRTFTCGRASRSWEPSSGIFGLSKARIASVAYEATAGGFRFRSLLARAPFATFQRGRPRKALAI
jgi:hypothetical protein